MLEECRESVRRQTFPVEHLVGCGDGRPEADVLNELIALADCDAYLVLNDDDLLLPTCVEKCVAALKPGVDVVYPWCRVEGRDWDCKTDFSSDGFELPITALVRKKLFHELGGYKPRGDRWSDQDFWARASSRHAGFVHIPEELWVYRFHGDNMSLG